MFGTITTWGVIKFILKAAVVLFVAVNVFMQGKPAIAIVLAIIDFIKSDKKQFKGFGFWLYCGLGGSGKTLSMVEYLTRMKKRYPRVKILTNFNFKYADGRIESWEDIINTENFVLDPISKEEYDKTDTYNRVELDGKYYKKHHYGVIFGFDEIHLTFASQKWASCPDNMLEYISQQRKLHKQIVASSQVFTRIDVKLREQTNYVIECNSIFGGRLVFNKFFTTDQYLAAKDAKDNGRRRRKRSKRYSFVGYNSIRENYDTMQVMRDLSAGKSEDAMFADKLRELLR